MGNKENKEKKLIKKKLEIMGVYIPKENTIYIKTNVFIPKYRLKDIIPEIEKALKEELGLSDKDFEKINKKFAYGRFIVESYDNDIVWGGYRIKSTLYTKKLPPEVVLKDIKRRYKIRDFVIDKNLRIIFRRIDNIELLMEKK